MTAMYTHSGNIREKIYVCVCIRMRSLKIFFPPVLTGNVKCLSELYRKYICNNKIVYRAGGNGQLHYYTPSMVS